MQKTKIEYLTHTWNPIAMRCTPVSEGCRNCWHLAMAKRLAGNPKICNEFKNAYAGVIPPVLIHTEVEAPLHLRKPARIGIQFMGDLFHGANKNEWVAKIFDVMEDTSQHTYFLLTKRPENIENFLIYYTPAAFPNLWLGVSVEDQKTADERIPILLQIPAAHRWVSVEPMLGAVNLRGSSYGPDWLEGWDVEAQCCGRPHHFENGSVECCGQPEPVQVQTKKLDWVVVGGETGLGARPLHPDWVRSLRDQCQAAGVPFFFKGWGEWVEKGQETPRNAEECEIREWGRIGHKYSGHLLDGKEWRQIPK